MVLDRDRLDQCHAIGFQQTVDGAEVSVEVLVADRFDHLDRNETVEAALEIAVVLDQQGNAIAEAGGIDALPGEVVLLARDGRGRYPAAVVPRGVQGEAAPAGADLEHVVLRAEAELAADAVELARRRSFEGFVFGLEQRRGVHHVLVEEQPEQLIAEIVVRGDVAATATSRVAHQGAPAAHGPAAEAGESGFHGVEVVAIAHEDAGQGDQIVAVPEAIHVGLAGADAAIQSELPIERGIMHADMRVQGVFRGIGRRPERGFLSGLVDRDAAVTQALQRIEKASAQDPVLPGRCLRVERCAIDGRFGSGDFRVAHGRAAFLSGWSWTGLPRSHRRSACQWMAATIRVVISG